MNPCKSCIMLLYHAMFFNNNDAICRTQYWL